MPFGSGTRSLDPGQWWRQCARKGALGREIPQSVGGGGARRSSKKAITQLIQKGFFCAVSVAFPYVFPCASRLELTHEKTRHAGGFLGDWAGGGATFKSTGPPSHAVLLLHEKQHQKKGAGRALPSAAGCRFLPGSTDQGKGRALQTIRQPDQALSKSL